MTIRNALMPVPAVHALNIRMSGEKLKQAGEKATRWVARETPAVLIMEEVYANPDGRCSATPSDNL
jgi:hypothetical protein